MEKKDIEEIKKTLLGKNDINLNDYVERIEPINIDKVKVKREKNGK